MSASSLRFSSASLTVRLLARVALAVPLALALLGAVGGCVSSNLTYVDPQVAGAKYFNAGDYTQAAGAYTNVVRDNPRDYQAYYYLGASYEALNAHSQAIQAYKTGLDVQPLTYAGKEDEALHLKLIDGLATAVSKSSLRDSELDTLQAKAQKTQSPWDYFLVAKVSRYTGDADAALEQYNHAALLSNKSFPILKEYGLYLQQLNQTTRARQVLWQAGAINQDDKEVASALRQLDVVPGPSLGDKNDLAKPVIPVGPIPPFNEIIGRNKPAAAPSPAAPIDNTQPAASLQAPRE